MAPRLADAVRARWDILISRTVRGLLIAAISGGLFWLVWIYASGLRDPRYLDGWVLAGGMVLQVSFHIAKTAGLSPKSATRWRKIHIFAGYLVIAAFISHSDFSLPDTGFEWALWTGFVLVTLSGILGTYLIWSLQAKRLIDDSVSYDRIPALRAELELAFLRTVAEPTRPPLRSICRGCPMTPGSRTSTPPTWGTFSRGSAISPPISLARSARSSG